jgi:hypothetical protein
MTAAASLARARASGLTLTGKGDRLHIRGPQPAPDLLSELKANKAELLRLLANTVLPAASPEQAAEERADREAIAAEPLLPPPPGSPERDRMDRRHAEVLDGYRRAALQRPPAWCGANNWPTLGCWCSCCHGRRWWRGHQNASGWRCSTCHPPVLPVDRLVGVET